MPRLKLRALLALVAASTILCAQRPLTAEDVITLPRVGDPQISPDGSMVAYSVGEPSFETNKVPRHIWLVATDGKGEPKQITKGDGESDPRWSPDGRAVLVRSFPSVYLLRLDGSAPVKLTDGDIGDWGTSPAVTVPEARLEPRWVLSRQTGRVLLRGTASHARHTASVAHAELSDACSDAPGVSGRRTHCLTLPGR